MKRFAATGPLVVAAVVGLLAAAGPARGDDVGGEGFGVPGLAWSTARDRLLVQLRSVDDPHAADGVFRQDIPFTRTVLMLAPAEKGGEARDVTLLEAAAWRQRPEDLFDVGLENALRRFPPTVRKGPEGMRARLNLFYSEEPFAAVHALAVDRFPRCRGKKGTIFAVPNRYGMFCYPVDSSRAHHAYIQMVTMSAQVFENGEDVIVPHVFWHHEGRYETQHVTIHGGRYESERTPAFRKLMKSLPRDIHDSRARRW